MELISRPVLVRARSDKTTGIMQLDTAYHGAVRMGHASILLASDKRAGT